MNAAIVIRRLGRSDVGEFVRLRLQGFEADPASFGSDVDVEKVKQIHLMVETTNPALALYRSLGFCDFGIDRDAYQVAGVFHSEYLMRKFVRSRQSELGEIWSATVIDRRYR